MPPTGSGSPDTERRLAWAMNQGPTRRRLFTEVLPLLSRPTPVPDDVEHLVEPLSWLVMEIGEGARVSTSGTLNRALVQALDARYGFNPTGKPPQSEAHVFQVTLLRELAQRLGLVRRKGTTLSATAAGRSLATDPAALWHRFSERALPKAAFDRFVGETWLAAQLAHGPLGYPQDRQIAAAAAREHGWRAGAQPVDERDVNEGINVIAWSFRLLLLLGGERGWSTTEEGLTPAGRSAAIAILRHAAETA